jgi:flagellar hook assembly protein FlgD
MRKVFYAIALCLLPWRSAHAYQVTGATLSNFTINAENLTTAGNFTGTTIQYNLDGPADVVVTIVNSSSQTVATLSQNYAGTGSDNPQKIFWNGLWLIGNALGRQDGNYLFSITATSGTNTSSASINQSLNITSVDVHNLAVSSSLDANGNTTFPFKISYALAKAANVTLAIQNSSGTVISTLVNNKLQVGENVSTVTVTWNGLDSNGRIAPVGLYTTMINASDPSTGDRANAVSQSIVVQSLAGSAANAQETFEKNVYVYPNPVRNSQAFFNVVPVRDNAIIHLRIYTISGTLVLDQDITSQLPYPWKAVNQAGNKVGRGLYYYVVREDDAQGTLQVTKKMAVLP